MVSFSKKKTVVLIPSRSEFNVQDAWYVEEDFRRMKNECKKLLKRLAKSGKLYICNDDATLNNYSDQTDNPKDNDDFNEEETIRGLEKKTPRGARIRQKNRFLALDIVLNEQERQWQQNKVDYDYIAQLYHQSTQHCQESAYLAGKSDAKAVERYLEQSHNVDGCCDRSNSMGSTSTASTITENDDDDDYFDGNKGRNGPSKKYLDRDKSFDDSATATSMTTTISTSHQNEKSKGESTLRRHTKDLSTLTHPISNRRHSNIPASVCFVSSRKFKSNSSRLPLPVE